MNILFRSDSSSHIGAGHIMRNIVLAKQFDKDNVIFATQKLDGNINYIIKDNDHKVVNLQSNDINEVIAIIKKYMIDLIVIDHYQINHLYEKKLKKSTGVKILSLDDTYEKHHCDILLNHNMSANAKRYKDLVPKNCEIRCGEDFTLLRDEFINEKKLQKNYIFIAMGGVDHSDINIKILNILSKYKNIKIHITTMQANKNIDKLQAYVKDKKWIKLHINSSNIAKLMRKCDFAILTPSVTVHEARYMNLPIIAIQTAQNQQDMCLYLREKKFFCLKKFDEEKLKNAISKMLNDIKQIGKSTQ